MSTELAPTTDHLPEARNMVSTKQKPNRLEDSLFSKELAPHYLQLSAKLATSAMVGKHFQNKPHDLFIAMAMGYQLGMSVEQAIQCIAVINGRPCMWGDEMLALCMVHKDFVDIIEEPIMEGSKIMGYKCTIKRRGLSDHTKVFTLEMAKRARLLSKPGPWQDYPERMMQLRARSIALRDRFPDALKGIKSAEEVRDYIDGEYSYSDDTKSLSQTEKLKKDFLTKTGKLEHEKLVQEAMDTVSDILDSTQAVENGDVSTVADSGEQETAIEASDGIGAISDAQLKTINNLLEEKGFTPERLAKALAYYEVDCVDNMPHDLADHFISQLERA